MIIKHSGEKEGECERSFMIWLFIALSLSYLIQTGCSAIRGIGNVLDQTNVELRNAVDSFDRAIDALSRQSSDWQVVLQNLEETLIDDAQSTIRVEVTNLMESGIASAGGEFRCDVEFLRIRTEQELRRIRNDLARALNEAGANPPIPILPELPAEPYICNASPGAVDISLDSNRRSRLDIYGFNFRSLPITVEVVDLRSRRNVTSALGIIGDMHMVLDLSPSGANIDEDSRRIVFTWNMVSQSVIPVVSPSLPVRCTTRIERITGDPESFVPPHTRGDKDFNGNGPCVGFGISLNLDTERTRLSASYNMLAFECDNDFSTSVYDYTTARGAGNTLLFQVTGSNEQILGHNLDSNRLETRYIDDDHSDDIRTFAGISPIEKLIFTGDTSGDEAGTETGVEIFFREIEVQVESCTN